VAWQPPDKVLHPTKYGVILCNTLSDKEAFAKP
jgi:hypothetical protein